jgi:hypothetical protein
VALLLSGVSLLCLAGYYLALTDVWHELGSPDVWRGEGLAATEWRFLSVAFWPMLLFHAAAIVALAARLES